MLSTRRAGFDIRVRRDDLLRIAFETWPFRRDRREQTGDVSRRMRRLTCWCSIGTKLSAELIEPDVPAIELLLAKARQEHVKQLFVAGREIVRDGAVTGVDLPALEAELLATLRQVSRNDGRHPRRHARTARRIALALLRSALLRVNRPAPMRQQ